MTATPASPRIIGSLRSEDGVGVVRMEDRFDTDIDDLWSALTEPARLARWVAEVEGDLRPGGEFRAHFHTSGWEGTGRVETCEPPRRLVVVTKEASLPYEETFDITLTPDGDQTIFVLEDRGMPPDHLAAYGAGVQVHVEDLAAHIEGRDSGDGSARWQELMPPYEELAAKTD